MTNENNNLLLFNHLVFKLLLAYLLFNLMDF